MHKPSRYARLAATVFAGGDASYGRNALSPPHLVQSHRTRARQYGSSTIEEERRLPKEEMLEFDGTVVEVLPDGNFRVKLDNEHLVLAYAAGKMKKNRIRTLAGDRVIVEMSPYDLDRGRISFRHKTGAPVPPAQDRRQNFRRR